MIQFEEDLDFASTLDNQDELSAFRDQFVNSDPELIYLDGNSLGRLAKKTVDRMEQVIRSEWGTRLVRGWNEGWFTAPERIGAKIAGLIGADPEEVVIADSTSVGLFKLVTAALVAQTDRTSIVSDRLNFPSDIYVLQGIIRLLARGHELKLLDSTDGMTIAESQLERAIGSDTALVTLSHVAFKSGFAYDIGSVTQLAHDSGALILWDLCHSVGVMPTHLDRDGVDLAVGCTYKYLNAGPGAPAFLFVRRELQDKLQNPISGWFGQHNQFDFSLDYQAAPGMRRFLSGTPPILSLAATEPAIDLVLEAGIERLRAKSILLTEYLIFLWQKWLEPLGVTLNSPRDYALRGSHVSLGHPKAIQIDRALIEGMKVIPDFRHPDNIRLGVAPLYTSFGEVREAMLRFRRIMIEHIYDQHAIQTQDVT